LFYRISKGLFGIQTVCGDNTFYRSEKELNARDQSDLDGSEF
jgi:hypothetical protein